MKLSKKKEDELYTQVYNDIMKVRLEVLKKYNTNVPNSPLYEIANLLQELSFNAPQNAINLFKHKP